MQWSSAARCPGHPRHSPGCCGRAFPPTWPCRCACRPGPRPGPGLCARPARRWTPRHRLLRTISTLPSTPFSRSMMLAVELAHAQLREGIALAQHHLVAAIAIHRQQSREAAAAAPASGADAIQPADHPVGRRPVAVDDAHRVAIPARDLLHADGRELHHHRDACSSPCRVPHTPCVCHRPTSPHSKADSSVPKAAVLSRFGCAQRGGERRCTPGNAYGCQRQQATKFSLVHSLKRRRRNYSDRGARDGTTCGKRVRRTVYGNTIG